MKWPLVILAAIAVIGCGVNGRRLPEEAALDKDKREAARNKDQSVHSSGGTLTVYSDGKVEQSASTTPPSPASANGREVIWTTTWKEAELDFNLEDSQYGGKVKEVSGNLYDSQGNSSYVAREAVIEKGTHVLHLIGGVKIESAAHNAKLDCAEAFYDGDSKILEAGGGITFNQAGFAMRGFERLTLNADLTEAENKMKAKKPMQWTKILVASTLIAGAHAKIQDIDGKLLTITGSSKWATKRLPNGQIQLTVTGAPVVMDWKVQGIVLQAPSIVGVVSKETKLVSATMDGGIKFTSGQHGSGLTVSAPKANYTDGDGKLAITGTFKLDTTSPKGETMHAEGSGGTVFLDREAKGDKVIKTADVNGPIAFKLHGMRTDDETKKQVPYTVNGNGQHLHYDEAAKQIVLEGDVNFSGDDPSLLGTMKNINKVTVTLTDSHEIDSIEMTGDPGKTIIEQKSKGGGGGKRR